VIGRHVINCSVIRS